MRLGLLDKLLGAAGRRRGRGPAEIRRPRLGPHWHFVEWPATAFPSSPHGGLLAIGPGGVYAICPIRQGRSRLLIAGDVVQINGERPPFVADARTTAARLSRVLSAAVDSAVRVTPVLHVLGSGVLSVYGLPEGVFVTTDKDLDRFLVAGGVRLSRATAGALARVAEQPAIWP